VPPGASPGIKTVMAAAEPNTAKVSRVPTVVLAVAAVLLVTLGSGMGILWSALTQEPASGAVTAPNTDALAKVSTATAAVAQGGEALEKPDGHGGDAVKPLEMAKPDEVPRPAKSRETLGGADPTPASSLTHRRWAKAEKFERTQPEASSPSPAVGERGTVQVTSDPPTEVWVDGRPAAVTPATLQLSIGAHKVELREPRLRLVFSRIVDVDPAKEQVVQWKPSHGSIDVRPVPPHVELQISVDGVSVGPTPISEFSVWEGVRRVSALNTATGWQVEQNVEVPPGGRVRIKVNDGNGMEVSDVARRGP
jgi:hypothetical protein